MNAEEKLIDIRNQIDAFLNQDLFVKLTRKSDHILAEHTEGIDDLRFRIDKGKWHSVADMREDLGIPPPALIGTAYKIGKPENVNKGWDVIVEKDGETAEGNLPEIESGNTDIYWGIWDDPEIGNIHKVYSSQIDRLPENHGKVIVMIGGFTNDMSRAKIKEKLVSKMSQVEIDVYLYILQDEPHLGSGQFTKEQVNEIIDVAQENYPNETFGFSISDNAINNKPIGSDAELIIPINTYLFLHEEYPWEFIETKQEFWDECDRVFENARQKFPNSTFMFVAQGIQDSTKYRKPPIESVEWTEEYAQSHPDITGVLWYDKKGLDSMPDLREAIQSIP